MVLSSSSAEREAAIQAGVQGFVTKPVRASRLGHEIARVLGAGQLVPAVDPASAPARLAVADGRPVLVAEDKSVNQLVAVRLLEKLGFRADIASNGREAVEMHARGTYEAIFMDCQMPELDGYQATAEIRRRESGGRHTPIIAMTAHTLRGDRERCLAAGMDDYIGKPIRTADLADVVTRALARADEPRAHRAGDNGEAPLMDAARLADVFGDDEESRSSLLAQFLAQARATIADLGQAIEDGDSEAIARLAHGLKGSSAVVGAERLSRVAAELSEGGAANRLDDAAALHDELTAVFELTDRELAPITSEESR
jgi:CheY-like chemotaxis protein/HPt (histidine-containing phosphotransfer) domain-containing protein